MACCAAAIFLVGQLLGLYALVRCRLGLGESARRDGNVAVQWRPGLVAEPRRRWAGRGKLAAAGMAFAATLGAWNAPALHSHEPEGIADHRAVPVLAGLSLCTAAQGEYVH